MKSVKFAKRIRNYAIASFLIPLIAINSCLLIYKFVGNTDVKLFPNFNWDQVEHTYTYSEHYQIHTNLQTRTFTNCPKYKYLSFWTTVDDLTILGTTKNSKTITELAENNKIKFVTFKNSEILNHACVKNHHTVYSLFKKYSWLETIYKKTVQDNLVGFAKIKNPYLYGEVSISRTARYFPATLIFKSLIILSSFLLFLYWKNNLNLFSELENKNILVKSSKKYFYFGIFSCIFLALHATFLGLDFDSKLFVKIRRLIIILFILFEILAQIYLTKNLFRFRDKLKKYINPLILKIKIIFVIIIFFTTCLAFTFLAFGDPSTAFKHILEWNYFCFLLLYYLLSRLLWKNSKNQVHTPEGV